MRLAVIIPVHNASDNLAKCLDSIALSTRMPDDILIVDDASTDGSAERASEHAGVKTIVLEGKKRGPAYARNRGAEKVNGDIIIFIDSDVLVHQDTFERIEAIFENNPNMSALFGSYDDTPVDRGYISRFKNLLHHFVHQHGSEAASTFWSGCGAIRKRVFEEVGGFDEAFPIPSIEDIELGSRLKAMGYQILLKKEVLVTHLKKWTFFNWIKTDIVARAIPWTRLILSHHSIPNELNVNTIARISAICIWLTLLSLLLLLWIPVTGYMALVFFIVLILINGNLWIFFYRHGGFFFTCISLFLYGLYLLYSSTVFIGVGIHDLIISVFRQSVK